MKTPVIAAALTFGCVQAATAQVVLETDTGSVAGAIETAELYDDYTLQSRSGEILFVDVASDVYQTRGRAHGEVGTEQDEGDGCAGEDAAGVCVQVIDPNNTVVYWATRPVRPGWQRDPRLACALSETAGRPQTYTLRVARRAAEPNCGPDTVFVPGDEKLYMLNVSLRTHFDGGRLVGLGVTQ